MIGKLVYSTLTSKENIEKLQQQIRDEEWRYLINEISSNAHFLDVGCGAGYAMERAFTDKNCKIFGVDPEPGAHGVGRFIKDIVTVSNIQKGFAENLPFEEQKFDVVFSSHVLEHVDNEIRCLQEMKRVLKNDGILIIGMPTATMAWINLGSTVVFTTHIKIYEFIKSFFTQNLLKNFIKIFRISSHSYPRSNSIWYDIKHYRVQNWKKTVEKEFLIQKTILPCLYPYPDYPQFFKLHGSKLGSSSVFFVCRKKFN
jgi:ubiquinone/menaquinone biosynthesis C-methylase UbiE